MKLRLLRGLNGRGLSDIGLLASGQAIMAVSALVRIPIVIHDLGVSWFGLLTTVGAVFPWLNALAAGGRIMSRTTLSETAADNRPSSARALLRLSNRSDRLLILGATIPATIFAVLVPHLLDVELGVATRAFCGFMVLLAGLVSAAGGVAMGYLDSMGRFKSTIFSAILIHISAIPLTILACKTSFAFAWLLLITAFVFTGSGIFAIFQLLTSTQGVCAVSPAMRIGSLAQYSAQGIGALLASGFDVVAVSATRSLQETAQFALNARLGMPVLVPATALAPRQFLTFGALRQEPSTKRHYNSMLRRAIKVNSVGAVTAALATIPIYWTLFPVLSHREFDRTLGLFCAILLSNIVSSIYATFFHAYSFVGFMGSAGWISASIGLLNLVITFVAANLMGVWGPPTASVVAYCIGIAVWIGIVRTTPTSPEAGWRANDD